MFVILSLSRLPRGQPGTAPQAAATVRVAVTAGGGWATGVRAAGRSASGWPKSIFRAESSRLRNATVNTEVYAVMVTVEDSWARRGHGIRIDVICVPSHDSKMKN